MHGYKQALFGDMAFGILGFILTMTLLPHSKPMLNRTETDKVDEAAAMEENTLQKGEAMTDETSEFRGEELDQQTPKSPLSVQQELIAEEGAVVAKAQFA